MVGANTSIFYSLLVFSSCILQGYSLPQRRMSAEEFGRKFGAAPYKENISNDIEVQEAGNPVAKEEQGLTQTLIEIAMKVLPSVINALSGTTGPSQTDRVDNIDLNGEDPFSVKNIIFMGLKLFLAVAGNANGVSEKSDGPPSPTQGIIKGVMEAVITAATGSKDSKEVAVMADQATQVIDLLINLVQTLSTSISQKRSYYY